MFYIVLYKSTRLIRWSFRKLYLSVNIPHSTYSIISPLYQEKHATVRHYSWLYTAVLVIFGSNAIDSLRISLLFPLVVCTSIACVTNTFSLLLACQYVSSLLLCNGTRLSHFVTRTFIQHSVLSCQREAILLQWVSPATEAAALDPIKLLLKTTTLQ